MNRSRAGSNIPFIGNIKQQKIIPENHKLVNFPLYGPLPERLAVHSRQPVLPHKNLELLCPAHPRIIIVAGNLKIFFQHADAAYADQQGQKNPRRQPLKQAGRHFPRQAIFLKLPAQTDTPFPTQSR